MTRGVDQVDEETIAILLLGDIGQVLVRKFVVEGDSSVGGQDS